MAYTSLENKNILFLQGTQQSLNTLITNGSAKDGAFYLTNDTHRLYVGRKNSDNKIYPVAVNEGVMTVDTIDQLNALTGINAGEFYYVKNSNILCIYNGSKFVQINPDNNTSNNKLSNSITVDDEKSIATIETAVTDTDGKTVSDTFQIKDSSGHTLIDVEDVGTPDDPSYVLDLKADEYTLGASVATEDGITTATISLDSANTIKDSSVIITAGDNISIVGNGEENNFKINSSYHNTIIKSDSEQGVVLSLDKYTDKNTTATGKVKIVITDSDNEEHIGETDPITYKVGSVDYIPGNTLPVYTKNEVDSLINGINGMTYKGTVGNTDLPTTGIQCGDTYLVNKNDVINISAENSYTGEAFAASKGDLLIATGKEDNGVITSELKWSYVPAGDDAEHDTHYSWESNAVSNEKVLKEDENIEAGSWKLEAGNAIDISSQVDSANNKDMTTTISHADIHSSETLEASTGEAQNGVTSLEVVSNVIVNKQGHVTKFEKTNYNLQDTTYTLSGASITAVTKDQKSEVEITHTLTGSDEEKSESTVIITSETLKMSAETNSYSIDLQWGSF